MDPVLFKPAIESIGCLRRRCGQGRIRHAVLSNGEGARRVERGPKRYGAAPLSSTKGLGEPRMAKRAWHAVPLHSPSNARDTQTRQANEWQVIGVNDFSRRVFAGQSKHRLGPKVRPQSNSALLR